MSTHHGPRQAHLTPNVLAAVVSVGICARQWTRYNPQLLHKSPALSTSPLWPPNQLLMALPCSGNISDFRTDVWQQFTPPPAALALLESKLGDKWLGMDVGEQDGR